MENKTNSNNKPVLREKLPNNPVAFLKEVYPPRVNGAGITMGDNIDYITEERAFLENENIKECIANKGLEALGLLWYLRLMMANSLGWGIEVTDKNYTKLRDNLATDLNVTKNKVEKMIQKLIDSKIMLVIQEDNRTYWTTLQQFYNYEYKCWYKIRNNIAAKKYQESKKLQTQAIDTEESIIDSMTPQTTTSYESSNVPEEFLNDVDENEIF